MAVNLASRGLVTLTDDHGNSLRGRTLACVGSPPVELTRQDAKNLYGTLWPFAAIAIRFDGEIPLHGLESPIQSACTAIKAYRAGGRAYPPTR